MTPPAVARSVAIFDLGGVLVEWNPRHLYRKLFAGDEAAMEDFLANVCTTEWNELQDAGRTFAEGTAALMPRHSDKRELIEAWSAVAPDRTAVFLTTAGTRGRCRTGNCS